MLLHFGIRFDVFFEPFLQRAGVEKTRYLLYFSDI